MTQCVEQKIVQMYKDWVYCLDCGLLIEPWRHGKKRITICEICKQVYTMTTHPWLKKMLALHINTHKAKKFTNKKVFECLKCGNFFFQHTNEYTKGICKWCTLLDQQYRVDKPNKCIICGELSEDKYNKKRICNKCVDDMENIQDALRYTFHVLATVKKK